MKKSLLITLTIILLSGLIFGGLSKAAASGEIELKLVTAWTSPYLGNVKLEKFVEQVNKEGAGKVKINWLGGAEIAPPMEIGKLCSKGTYDMIHNTAAFYAGLVPEGMCVLYVTGSMKELRDVGFMDLMDEIHRKRAGLTVLGILWRGERFSIYSKIPVKSLDDFKGMKISGAPPLFPFIKGLGGSPVTVATQEMYTAMERGVVDANMAPAGLVAEHFKIYEVAKYVIKPEIPWQTCAYLVANAARWDSLPAEVKTLIMNNVLSMETEAYDYYRDLGGGETERLLAKGMQVSQLSDADAAKYKQLAYETSWSAFVKRNPEYGPKLYETLKPLMK